MDTGELVEGPWLCRECWGSDAGCDCPEPDYAQTYFLR